LDDLEGAAKEQEKYSQDQGCLDEGGASKARSRGDGTAWRSSYHNAMLRFSCARKYFPAGAIVDERLWSVTNWDWIASREFFIAAIVICSMATMAIIMNGTMRSTCPLQEVRGRFLPAAGFIRFIASLGHGGHTAAGDLKGVIGLARKDSRDQGNVKQRIRDGGCGDALAADDRGICRYHVDIQLAASFPISTARLLRGLEIGRHCVSARGIIRNDIQIGAGLEKEHHLKEAKECQEEKDEAGHEFDGGDTGSFP
jgi:hypothetical protein